MEPITAWAFAKPTDPRIGRERLDCVTSARSRADRVGGIGRLHRRMDVKPGDGGQ
ncbi:hypothetical protein AArcMg_1270 [Natrarchaeobaculum sulfurireducens]|uniref:Uncharacterized protein n=1 Tax=Natrarchaeobaculum sulfurireducens TaxID=2044521 RepID=A0A346PP41_9EURY|nr:hypothetical protein AArcMg_1270 [Natrarchaeobaculum sulfurireducens]